MLPKSTPNRFRSSLGHPWSARAYLGALPGRSWGAPETLPGHSQDALGRSQGALGSLWGAIWTSLGLLGSTLGHNLLADPWPCGFRLDSASIFYDFVDRCAHRFYVLFRLFSWMFFAKFFTYFCSRPSLRDQRASPAGHRFFCAWPAFRKGFIKSLVALRAPKTMNGTIEKRCCHRSKKHPNID